MNKKSFMANSRKISTLFLAFIMIVMCAYTPIPVSAANPYTNLVLESVFFTDGNGLVVTSPEGKDNLVPYVVISKNEGGTALAGKVIISIYNGNVLSDVSVFDISSGATVFGEVAFTVDRNTYKGPAIDFPVNGTAKAFFWDSFAVATPYVAPTDSAMAPLGEQYTGPITFPTQFQSKMTGKFEITKEAGVRKYSHNATPEKLYDWSDATEIFLSSTVNYASSTVINELGTDRTKPIAGRNFATKFNAGSYKKADGTTAQDKFIFTLLDDIYSGSTDPYGIPLNNLSSTANNRIATPINALIRSGSNSGYTWMGRMRRQTVTSDGITQKWTAVDGKTGVYQTIQGTSTAGVLTLMNFNSKDAYGMPRPYVLVDSIDACVAAKGTFYQDTVNKFNIYCNPYDGQQLDDISLVLDGAIIDGIRSSLTNTVMFENIGFMPKITALVGNQITGTDYNNSVMAFFGCKFPSGATNTISLAGKYTAYLFDCASAYGFRDGFNYHSDITATGSSTVIEVNSISYNQGDTNRITNSGAVTASTKNSNNASTAHDGINILRVGGKYWDTQGPIVGDLNCLAISMGCESYNFNIASPSERTTFMEYDDTTPYAAGKNKYIVDCLGTGIKIRAGIVGNVNTYVLDFVGNTRLGKDSAGTADPLKPITWAEIESGAWKE